MPGNSKSEKKAVISSQYIRSFFDYLPSTASSFCVPCHQVFHQLFSSFRLCSVFAPVKEKRPISIRSIRHQGRPREAHHALYRDFNKPYPETSPIFLEEWRNRSKGSLQLAG